MSFDLYPLNGNKEPLNPLFESRQIEKVSTARTDALETCSVPISPAKTETLCGAKTSVDPLAASRTNLVLTASLCDATIDRMSS